MIVQSVRWTGRSRDRAWVLFPGHELVFAIVVAFAITLVTTASEPGPGQRWLAAGLLALCWLAGPLAQAATARGQQRWATNAYMVVVAGLFTGAGYISMLSCAALFAIGPQSFVVLPVPKARRLVVFLSIVPAVRFISSPPARITVATFCVTAVLTLVFSLGAGSWMRQVIDQNSERADLIDRLRAAHAEVGRLSEERGMLAERERLAREIHDTLTQGFASILMLVQAAARNIEAGTSAHEQLLIAAQTARENLSEARTLVAELAPASLAGSLQEALRRLADRVEADLGIPVSLSVPGTPRDLQHGCELALLRAAQEGLANVRKHAQASSVRLELGYGADTVRLTVSDDGCGFDPARSGTGFGLRGMRSRAELVGGSLLIHSAPGQGTTITLQVPAREAGPPPSADPAPAAAVES